MQRSHHGGKPVITDCPALFLFLHQNRHLAFMVTLFTGGLESTYPILHPLSSSPPYRRLIQGRLNGPQTDWLTLTNKKRDRNLKTYRCLLTNLTRFFQPISTDQTYNNIDWPTLFTWLWRCLPLRLPRRHCSSFQNYPHPLDHTNRTTYTTAFKPFTM